MAKLIVFTALMLLLAATTVSAFRTIVTVTVDEPTSNNNNNQLVEPIQSDSCKDQIKKQELNHCERFLNVSSIKRKPRRKEELMKCCEQLNEVDTECQCEAFCKVVHDIQHDQKHDPEGDEVMKELERIALAECGLIRCEIPRTPMTMRQLFRSKTFRF